MMRMAKLCDKTLSYYRPAASHKAQLQVLLGACKMQHKQRS